MTEFSFTPIGSVSCILFLWQLQLNLNMGSFLNLILKYLHSASLNEVDFESFGGKWHQKDTLPSCTRVILCSWYKTRFPGTCQSSGNSCWVWKKLTSNQLISHCWSMQDQTPFLDYMWESHGQGVSLRDLHSHYMYLLDWLHSKWVKQSWQTVKPKENSATDLSESWKNLSKH